MQYLTVTLTHTWVYALLGAEPDLKNRSLLQDHPAVISPPNGRHCFSAAGAGFFVGGGRD